MGQDERAVRVHHPETAKEDVPGDQVGDPRNDARHQDDHGEPLLPPARDRVGGGEPDGEAEGRAARRHHQAVPRVEEERILGEHLAVARHGDAEAHEGRRIRRRLDLRLERERDHPVEDEDRGQHEEAGERVEGGRGQPAAPRASPHHVVLLRTLIRISEAPMTTAKSATAMDEA